MDGGEILQDFLQKMGQRPRFPRAGRRFFFAALPLKYKNADGAPVRAVGIEN